MKLMKAKAEQKYRNTSWTGVREAKKKSGNRVSDESKMTNTKNGIVLCIGDGINGTEM